MSKSKLVFGLIILVFLLGNIFKPSFISPDIRLGLSDILVATIWLSVLSTKTKELISVIRQSTLAKPIIFFLLIALISLLTNGRTYGSTAFLVGLLYLLRYSFYVLLFLPLGIVINQDQSKKLLIYLGFTMIFTSLAQYLFIPDIRFLSNLSWDPHYYRVVGTLLDPGFVGIILIFTLSIFMPPDGSIPLFHSVPWALTYLSFALTYSRSSFLAFLSGFTCLSFIRKSWRLFLSSLLLISVTVIVLPRISDGEGVKLERISTIEARLKNWKESLHIFTDHIFTGVGFNTYRYAQKSYGFISGSNWQSSHGGAGADSSILFVAATTGIFGLITYFWYLLSLWKISSSNYAFKTGLVALFIHSWFLNSLFYPFILLWISIWIISVSRVKSHH
jgi:hypothetical protein